MVHLGNLIGGLVFIGVSCDGAATLATVWLGGERGLSGGGSPFLNTEMPGGTSQ